MKKFLIVFILFLSTVFCFAQAFDDLPFTNPDLTTWFQQEMSSLLRFQFENDINIPFFAALSFDYNQQKYKPEYGQYIRSFYSGLSSYSYHDWFTEMYISCLVGGQIKVNNYFYIPIFNYTFLTEYESTVDGVLEAYKNSSDESNRIRPYRVYNNTANGFFGTGVNINTDKLQGGIYLGYNINYQNINNIDEYEYYSKKENETSIGSFKIAILPLVDTSNMAYIGKALSSVMGFLGTGDAVMFAEREKGDSEIGAFMKTINAGLDFTFNKINFGPLSMKLNAIYLRGNYNLVAKADTFGLKLQGRLSNFPLGFSVEGGLKHFFSVARYLEKDYPDTGYVKANVYFPLKHLTVGMIYQYDIIYESKFIFAVSTNYLSFFYANNPRTNFNKNQFDEYNAAGSIGARFRWGGWKVKGK